MFSKSKRKGSSENTSSPMGKQTIKTGSPSIISQDLRILGDIICEGDIQVEGVIEGDVKTRLLTVGETALIKGSVICEEARIRGTVDGEIFARHVILAKSSRVRGDITHETIAIEAGAYLDGRCRRLEEGENDLEELLNGPTALERLTAEDGEASEAHDDMKALADKTDPEAGADQASSA